MWIRTAATSLVATSILALASPAAAEPSAPPAPTSASVLPVNPHRERITELEESLESALADAKGAAQVSREARRVSDDAGVQASSALVTAYHAARDADTARLELAEAQGRVNRWAAAAYRSTSVTAWELAAIAGEDITQLLHASGLGNYAADFHALLLEQAQDARARADSASRAARTAWVRAQLLLDVSSANERIADAKVDQARARVESVRAALVRREAAADAFDRRLAVELSLGIPFLLNVPIGADVLAAASSLKDVSPFAPGSGPNSTSRMGEWMALDVTVLPGTPRAYAVSQLPEYDWGLEQWPCLDRMWWHESGWDPRTTDGMQGTGYGELNANLTWGIPQANPAIKMADPKQNGGPDWATNPATQINWGLWYIKESYGSPCQAWAAWRARSATGSFGWY